MRYEEIKNYEGKNVKLILTNTYRYKAFVKKVSESSVLIIDKYNQSVTISLDNVALIMEDLENGAR